MNNDCVFCKIVNGEIPSYKIYEDKFTFAFLDLNNDGNGHVLVIPKKHYNNILDCDNEVLSHVVQTVKTVSKHLVDKCGVDGVNVLNASGKAAEQSVFHLHFHILPRKESDAFKAFPTLPENEISKEEVWDLFKISKD